MANRKIPTKQSKAELMVKIEKIMVEYFHNEPIPMVEYLLNYFTSWDLDGIYAELKEMNDRRNKHLATRR